jgi:hypothetical protein
MPPLKIETLFRKGTPVDAILLFFVVFMIAFGVLMIASMWITLEKAGLPGWACLIPIYNVIVLLQLAGKPLWWFLLLLIPFVNIIILFMIYIAIAQNFGKGVGFGVGLVFLSFIFFPILAFSDARYQPVSA